MLETYKPSGNFSPVVFGFAFSMLIVSFVIGVIYQGLTLLCPLIILNGLLLCGMALTIFKGAEWTLRWGKCRHAGIGMIIGLAIASVALFGSYRFAKAMVKSVAVAEAKESGDADLISQAENMTFGEYVDLRKAEGWSVGSRRAGKSSVPINGMFVYLFWAIEAGVFLLAGVIGASTATGRPFCEPCGKWVGKPINVWSARNASAGNVADMKAAEDLNGLFIAAAQRGMPSASFNFNLATCPECNVPGFLTVEKETVSQDKDGKEKTEKTDVIANIVAEPQEVARIAATMKR